MRRLAPLLVLLWIACADDSEREGRSSEALDKTKAQLDEARAELAEVKAKLADAKQRIKAYAELRRAMNGETGDATPLPSPQTVIACDSREHCDVDRTYFDLVMTNPLLLLEQVTILPWQKDGEMVGIKLFGIDDGSIPHALGLRSGDVVVAVSGQSLTSFNDVMTLGEKLYAMSRYELNVERSGEAFTLVVDLVTA